MKKSLIYLLLLLLAVSPVSAKKKENEVDYVALAALLIRDGHIDRAETALASVNLEDENLDKVRFYKLKGLVFLKKNMYAQAAKYFQMTLEEHLKVIALKQEENEKYQPDPMEEQYIHLYLAQAYYKLNNFQETLDSLDKAGELAKEKPNLYSIRAQCYWKLEDVDGTWDVLSEGEGRFPDYLPLMRQKFFYLMELKLFQEAVEYGEKYLASSQATVDDYLAIGVALRKSEQYEKALQILESAKMRFPGDVKIIVELAYTYMENDKISTAADLFEEASLYENKFSAEASELFRRTRNLFRALYHNSKIQDPKEKYKQRMAIFLELGEMEMAASMGPALSRVGLLKNEDLLYALAYSQYMIGHFDSAEENLQKLTRPDLFRKAAELRKSMEECVQDSWKCQ